MRYTAAGLEVSWLKNKYVNSSMFLPHIYQERGMVHRNQLDKWCEAIFHLNNVPIYLNVTGGGNSSGFVSYITRIMILECFMDRKSQLT